MKKNLFFLAAAAIAFAACSNETLIEEVQEQQLPMAFETSTENSTRSISGSNLVLESFHQSFGVWSYKKPATGDDITVMNHYGVFYDDTDGTGSADWDYDGKKGAAIGQELKYWDKYATLYKFYAYAPFNSTNASSTTAGTITIKSGEYAANENLQTWSTTLNSEAFTGTGATSTSATTDWMLADAVTNYTAYKSGTTISPVPLNFKHTLSKVIVILKHKSGFMKDIVVKSASIDAVYGTGSFDGSAWEKSGDSKSISAPVTGTGDAAAVGTIANTTDNNYYCMEYLVMPMTSAPKFSVTYTIGGEPFVVSEVAITNVTSFAANTVYTITATIGPDPIEFDATVSDFSTPTDAGSVNAN